MKVNCKIKTCVPSVRHSFGYKGYKTKGTNKNIKCSENAVYSQWCSYCGNRMTPIPLLDNKVHYKLKVIIVINTLITIWYIWENIHVPYFKITNKFLVTILT